MSTFDFSEAQWIHSRVVGSPRVMAPAPYFRKSFLLEKSVKSAQLSITALGLYEAEINGVKVGDHVLAPGWTDYHKRVAYQNYDVKSLLHSGENVLGAILGDGWYCGYVALCNRQIYGDRPNLLAQLRIHFQDGSELILATDVTWKTSTGPILENDLLKGEAYDARLELSGWSHCKYDESGWQPAILNAVPDMALVQSEAPPVRCIQEIKPISVQKSIPSGQAMFIFDLGQNFSGRIQLNVRAEKGKTLVLRYAEILQPDGMLYTENLRGARATDYYTCRGNGQETWEPKFTFHGFRYVEVTGIEPEHAVEITGIVIHSDIKPTGSFECSNPLLNQLQHNIVWGQKSNFLEAPTDCPQRDERLGWTGDAQVFIQTACFNMDVRAFFHKWLQDMRDAQAANGSIPPIIPDIGVTGGSDGGPAWSDASIICPWIIYLSYNDQKVLEDHYDSMRKQMDFIQNYRCQDYIRCHPDVDLWGGFGDWLALDGSGIKEGNTPKDLIGTAFYAHIAQIMGRVARLLGKLDDAEAYEKLHHHVVKAFQDRFVTPKGIVASGTQTAYVLALHFQLIPPHSRTFAAAELVRAIKKADYHIATGFVGTPYILDVLETNGHIDIAYRLLEQETFPSWLFPVKNGATTIWERWDGWTPDKGFQDKEMNSFNHYAYGAVGSWMYRSVAGLDLDPDSPGYRHIIFRPRPGGSLTWAKAKLATPYGEASIRWDIQGEQLDLDLVVPKGTQATLQPPEKFGTTPLSFEGGHHRLSLPAPCLEAIEATDCESPLTRVG